MGLGEAACESALSLPGSEEAILTGSLSFKTFLPNVDALRVRERTKPATGRTGRERSRGRSRDLAEFRCAHCPSTSGHGQPRFLFSPAAQKGLPCPGPAAADTSAPGKAGVPPPGQLSGSHRKPLLDALLTSGCFQLPCPSDVGCALSPAFPFPTFTFSHLNKYIHIYLWDPLRSGTGTPPVVSCGAVKSPTVTSEGPPRPH